MNIDFNVCQNCDGVLTITDKSLYEESLYFRDFSYEDTVTINIITSEHSEDPELVGITYTTHDLMLDEASVSIEKDGLYNVTHIIVPSLQWYNTQKELKFNNLSKYKLLIISDGKNLYQVIDDKFIPYQETELLSNINLEDSTIHKKQKLVFLTCFLWKCYINLALEAFRELIKNNQGNKVFKCGQEDELIVFKRDIVWSTIKVIEYLTEDCKFEEAQKILNRIMVCNGFCFSNSPEDIALRKAIGCGCHN